jgi:hypothetical protein
MNRLSCCIFILLFSNPSFSDTGIYGTYKQHVEDDLYSSLIVEKGEKDTVFITMQCKDGRPDYNSGLLQKTSLKLDGNSVRYHNRRYEDWRPCTIDIDFSKQGASVTQTEGYGIYCGFGQYVICDGEFIKQ